MQIVPLIHNSGNGGSRSIPICSMYCVYTNYIRLGQRLGTCFWVNYNISLTWIVQPFGDDSSKINHDSSEGEHWGRYNLPRCLYTFHTWSIGDIPYVNPSWFRSRFRIGWPWMISYPLTDPNGAAIYGVPWIPSIYPSHVSIYTSTMDPMG